MAAEARTSRTATERKIASASQLHQRPPGYMRADDTVICLDCVFFNPSVSCVIA